MKARKAIAMGLIAVMSVGVLAGCGGGDKKEEGVITIFQRPNSVHV